VLHLAQRLLGRLVAVLRPVDDDVVLRLVWPSRETPRPLVVAGVALALCVVVELAQLTGLPARVPQLRWVLGTTFAPVDLLWYAVGALGGAGAMVLVGRSRP
jgi:hypothetical protein